MHCELKWLATARWRCGINNNKFQWTGSNGGGFKFQEEIILKKSQEKLWGCIYFLLQQRLRLHSRSMLRNCYSVKLVSSKLEMVPNLSCEIQRQLWWGVYSDNFIPFALEIGTRREELGEQ